jgi:hypothetical protein
MSGFFGRRACATHLAETYSGGNIMKTDVCIEDMKGKLANQLRSHWREGSATCLRHVSRRELGVPPKVYDWFVSQLIVNKKTGAVVEFMNERSCLIEQFGPRRWSVIIDLCQMDQIADDMGPKFAPLHVRYFLKQAVATRCYSLRLENVDATEMSEWTE